MGLTYAHIRTPVPEIIPLPTEPRNEHRDGEIYSVYLARAARGNDRERVLRSARNGRVNATRYFANSLAI